MPWSSPGDRLAESRWSERVANAWPAWAGRLGAQPLASLLTPPLDHRSTRLGAHALAKPVNLLALARIGLISPLQGVLARSLVSKGGSIASLAGEGQRALAPSLPAGNVGPS